MQRSFFLFTALALAALLLSSCDKPLFTQVTAEESGITFSNRISENDTLNILDFEYIYNGGGAAIGDFNNDGLQDVFFSGNQVSNKLYLNKGDFKFTDITEKAGVGGNGKWCSGVAVVDINNDGWLDLYVGATVSKTAARRENLLYVNQGVKQPGDVPVFREMASAYGVADDGHTTNAAFFDYDNDGDLDLYVLTNTIENYPNAYHKKVVDGSSPTTDRLYRNDWNEQLGHPVFTNVSRQAGIQIEGYGLGLNICDINRDGWKDIYVTNDYLSDDLLYINNHDGTFTDQASQVFKHTSNTAMGNDVTDINNDGLMDIIAVDMLPQDNLRKKVLLGPNNYQTYLNNEEYGFNYQYTRNTLQLNQGFRPAPALANPADSLKNRQPVFSEISLLSNIAETDWSWTPLVIDFDHDGYRDLIVTNGFPKDITDRDFMQFRANSSSVASKSFTLEQIPVIKISNYAFRNQGDLTFTNVTKDWGLEQPSFSDGAAYGDLDNDGDLDFVINNINDSAFVYRNNLMETKAKEANYLRIKFKGNDTNRMGLGTFVEITYDGGKKQVYEHSPYRGYLSSVEPAAHFGLGAVSTVEQVKIIWPAQGTTPAKAQTLRGVKANQVLTVDSRNATEPATYPPTSPARPVFREVTDSLNLTFVHQEPEFIDFNVQKLLPHKLSQFAPAVSTGDVNGDGLTDLFIGGSRSQKGTFYLQTVQGTFVQRDLLPGPENIPPAPIGAASYGRPVSPKQEEDMGTLLFDADGDGDLDLYIASGGMEAEPNSPAYQDRLFINDGTGQYTLAPRALPKSLISKSCVKAADFDRDGDLDLFVGGRVEPAQYPKPVSSYILRNDSQPGQPTFTDVTASVAEDLLNLGLVCDALWTDFDNDGWMDLMLAGEWMPLTFLQNVNGKLTNRKTVTLPNSEIAAVGWWNSLLAADFDRDGDIDYIAGNLGSNTLSQASVKEPISVYAKDFDNNGFYDAILTTYFPDGNGQRKEFTFHGREDLIRQMISMRARFPLYKDFAGASVDKLLKEEELKDAIVLRANYMKSAYIENLGNGAFRLKDLPVQAQLAPVFGMLADDFDQDGHPDVLLVGNDHSNEVFVGRLDALNGLMLKGDGKGSFTALTPATSGFYVPGNAKGLTRLSDATGNQLIVATQNRGPLKVFRAGRSARVVPLKPTDVAAFITYSDGRREKAEFCYGQSFLSQCARELPLNHGVKAVEIIDSKGQRRPVSVGTLVTARHSR
ncbi:FG-GAP-like repeat-containing protein [Nibrella saemangeumensis]|uniref:FG-GAP-like repeat-containing protein n=1 Tax=Nibrella saemangeumensis TaxID=1084526 RepID=UPI0031F14562